MGRGRQKAKATKQARDMKYFSPATDLSALEAELTGKQPGGEDDDYTDLAEKYNDPDDDEADHDDASSNGSY